MRIRMISIIPCELADRLWKHPVLLVGTLHRLGEAVDDIEVGAAVCDGLDRLVAPLHPASAVDDAAFLLDAGTGRQNENFGGDSSRIDTRPLPETGRLMLEQIGDHQPIELVHRRAYQPRVGAAHHRVLAEAEEPFDFAGQHGVGEREKRVALTLESAAQLRQMSEVEIIFALRMFTPPRFQETDHILRRVLQPVGARGVGRHRSHALQVTLQVNVCFDWQFADSRAGRPS